jgi:hypothetical protein
LISDSPPGAPARIQRRQRELEQVAAPRLAGADVAPAEKHNRRGSGGGIGIDSSIVPGIDSSIDSGSLGNQQLATAALATATATPGVTATATVGRKSHLASRKFQNSNCRRHLHTCSTSTQFFFFSHKNKNVSRLKKKTPNKHSRSVIRISK